ncbi:2OG-Fe(II) oxygenase [Rhodospirillum sp. A1_3_36]|uniref:2OG-Fe(II) oxygenase n=1 Tax=Rhodospirillum sp. A1_3_36 TaxID=3391666 RepID=UPI0039A68567
MHPLLPATAELVTGFPSLAPTSPVVPSRSDAVAEALYTTGWCVLEDFLPADLTAALRVRAAVLESMGSPVQAGIGREEEHHLNQSIRETSIYWLNGADPAESAYLSIMEELRGALNRRLFLGLFEFESHFSFYEAGGFYARHLDALKGTRNRMVSIVSYLNPNWSERDGGELIIWDAGEDGREVAQILPKAGTVAVFLSEEIPHAVAPTHRPRLAIPGWFRINGSTADRIDPPR